MRLALDTNILVYAEGVNTAQQQAAAKALIDKLPTASVVLPAQVLGEFFHVLTRKFRIPAGTVRRLADQWMTVFDVVPTTADVLNEAFELADAHRIAGWDAVILSAAAQAGCRYLLSEDMQDGFSWRGVTVANPFATASLPAPLAALIADG